MNPMISTEHKFFLFGMGDREKFIYMNGKLIRVVDGTTAFEWDVANEEFLLAEYTVKLQLASGANLILHEDEIGFYIDDKCISASHINLPSFAGYKYAEQLRILHHEILFNIKDGKPLPNIFVYDKPWYRDGAMVGMVLKYTNNLHLIKDWILRITDLYDRNNKGNCEPDNLGQLLFLISLVADKSHPIVSKIIDEAKRITEGGLLRGITDYSKHEIYSSLWMDYALQRLEIDNSFIQIPDAYDSYARMFWMDRTKVERTTPYENKYNEKYPYLWWAVKHFENEPIDEEYLQITYPMSWEICASEANYEGSRIISDKYVENRVGAPHTWHASEMFLYLIEK